MPGDQTYYTSDKDKNTWTKTIYPTYPSYPSGQMPKNWTRQRIYNEETAIALVRKYTVIPVPEVVAVGDNKDGSSYITLRLLDDRLCPVSDIAFKCPHARPNVPCWSCKVTAEMNADDFLKQLVLPELAEIPTKMEVGLNGIVIPPPFVTAYDKRSEWEAKTPKKPNGFIHGDLGGNNLMCNKYTLLPKMVIDWENAGYYDDVCRGVCSGYSEVYYGFYSNDLLLQRYVAALEQ